MLSSVDELAYDAEISEMRSILYARAEEERQKAETRANASAARVVRMGEELRDCMGAAKVALDSVLTRLGAPMSVALPEADAKAFGAWLSEEVVSLKVVTQVVWDSGVVPTGVPSAWPAPFRLLAVIIWPVWGGRTMYFLRWTRSARLTVCSAKSRCVS
jgi:hypothetical protein